VNDYETFKSISTKTFNHQLWSSTKVGKLSKEFRENYEFEYAKLKDYSGYVINKNFNNIITSLDRVLKTSTGYSIHRYNSNYQFIVSFNINDNQIEIKRCIKE
jgi:hypothetical protein